MLRTLFILNCILLIGFVSCQTSTVNKVEVPAFLPHDYYIAGLHAMSGQQKVRLWLYNWRDGNQNAFLFVDENSPQLLTGLIGLDEKAQLHNHSFETERTDLSLNLNTPQNITGHYKTGLWNESKALNFEVENTKHSFLYKKDEEESEAVLFVEKLKNDQKLFLLHLSDSTEVKVFGSLAPAKYYLVGENSRLFEIPEADLSLNFSNQKVQVESQDGRLLSLVGEYRRSKND